MFSGKRTFERIFRSLLPDADNVRHVLQLLLLQRNFNCLVRTLSCHLQLRVDYKTPQI